MDSTNLPLKIANVLKSNILQELIDKEITTKKQVIRLISEELISELEQDVDVGQDSDTSTAPTEAEKKKVKSAVANMLNRKLFTGPVKKGGKPKPKEMLAAIEQAKQGILPISGFEKLSDALKKYAIELFNAATRTKEFLKSLASGAINQLKAGPEKAKEIVDKVADKLGVPEAAEEVAKEIAAGAEAGEEGALPPDSGAIFVVTPDGDLEVFFQPNDDVDQDKLTSLYRNSNTAKLLQLQDAGVLSGVRVKLGSKAKPISKDLWYAVVAAIEKDKEQSKGQLADKHAPKYEWWPEIVEVGLGEKGEEGKSSADLEVSLGKVNGEIAFIVEGDPNVESQWATGLDKAGIGDRSLTKGAEGEEDSDPNAPGYITMGGESASSWEKAILLLSQLSKKYKIATDPDWLLDPKKTIEMLSKNGHISDSEEAGEEETEGGTDPQMYDPDPEKLENLQNAYEEFRDEFYRSKYLVEQGKLVKALLDALRAVHEEEEREAAAIRTKAPPKLDEAEAEQVEGSKDELANLKADFRAFYENIRDAEDLLGDFKEKAEQGKFNSKQAKQKIISSMTEIQADVIKLHSDLEKIVASPVPQEQEKIEEVLIGSSPEDRKQKYEKIENAHDEIVKLLNGVLRRLKDTSAEPPQPKSSDREQAPDQMKEAEAAKVTKEEVDGAVKSALKQLEGILGLFPSVKPFEGEVEFDQLDVEYKKARKKLDFDVSNIQTLVKGGSVAEVAIRRQMARLIDFAADIERIFGVKGQVKGSNITQADAATPADETPTDPAGADDSSKPEEEPKEKTINDRATAEKFVEDTFLPRNLFDEIYEGNENIGDAQYNALLTFILLSRIRQPVQEASLPAMTTAANKIFGLGDEKTENMLVFMRKALPEKFEALNVLFVMGKNKVSDLRMLLQKQMKNRPFQFVTRLDKSMAQKLFKSSAAEPSKPSEETPPDTREKNPMLDMAPDRDPLSKIYKRERLMKILLPLIKEHLQRSQRG